MSLQQVTRTEDAPTCDYCGEEVRYYSDRHVRADVVDLVKNNNSDNQNTVRRESKLFWWREKKQIFGHDRYDFHGDCFIKLMDRLEELKKKEET